MNIHFPICVWGLVLAHKLRFAKTFTYQRAFVKYIHDSRRSAAEAAVCSDSPQYSEFCTSWGMLGKPRCRFAGPIAEKSGSSCRCNEFPAGKDHCFGFVLGRFGEFSSSIPKHPSRSEFFVCFLRGIFYRNYHTFIAFFYLIHMQRKHKPRKLE